MISATGLEEFLGEEISYAAFDVECNKEDGGDPSSYGNGYDKGFLDGLKKVENFIKGLPLE